MDFKKLIEKNSPRDKFVSKLFGIFSEEVASVYFESPFSDYENEGRPTIKKGLEDRGYTIDFTLKNKKTAEHYVCEMKCELQYQNCKHLELNNIEQINDFKNLKDKPAFKSFLDIAKHPNEYLVAAKKEGENKKDIKPSGIILLWGKVSDDKEKIEKIKAEFGFYEILSLEKMINEMIENKYQPYMNLINKKKDWCNFLCDNLSK